MASYRSMSSDSHVFEPADREHQNRHRVSRACADKPLVAAVDGKDEKACAVLGMP